MVAELRGLDHRRSREQIEELLTLLSLHDDRHASISGYSKGMRQKVLIAAALLHNPDLVLLDEPFSGLDVGSALMLRSLIQQLAAKGKVVLFSSHELDTVERVSQRVVILHKGKVVADEPIANLRNLMSLESLGGDFFAAGRRGGYGWAGARDCWSDRGIARKRAELRAKEKSEPSCECRD